MVDSEILTYCVKMAFFTMIKNGIESIVETPKQEELKGKYGTELMSYQLMEIKKKKIPMCDNNIDEFQSWQELVEKCKQDLVDVMIERQEEHGVFVKHLT